MKFDLFKKIVATFYKLNSIPVFVVNGKSMEYSTIDEKNITKNSTVFFTHFIKTGVEIFGDIEFYATFPYRTNNKEYNVIIGPMFSANPVTIGYKRRLIVEDILNEEECNNFLLSIRIAGGEHYSKYVEILAEIAGHPSFDTSKFTASKISLQQILDEHITNDVFLNRENLLSPYAPETEKRIMDMVRAGDIEAVKKINTAFTADAPGQGISYQFKVVSLVTVCTRAVLDSGVDATVAYSLSDRYLQMLGTAHNFAQISDIAKNVLPHFANLVLEKREMQSVKYSPHLQRAETYIKLHLHYQFNLSNVAKYVGVSEKYLSRLFVTHKGEKFSKYVNRCRIAEAKELLLNTNTSLTNISYSLGFVSESYFIKIFKEICDMTPNDYRKRFKNVC